MRPSVVAVVAVAGTWIASACTSLNGDDGTPTGQSDGTAIAGGSGGGAASGGAPSSSGGSGVAPGMAGSAGAGVAGSAGSTAGSAGSTAGSSASGSGGSGGSRPAGSGGSAGSGQGGSAAVDAGMGNAGDSGVVMPPSERFSFFVTSLAGLVKLSGSEKGFGGDLRYGEADGLSGADKICRELAEDSMPGAGAKTWHAFMSVMRGPGGQQVNAVDRVGTGPWYDRRGRLVAMTKADLQQTRPRNADAAIANDLPNEDGVPNHAPDPSSGPVDNHHTLTGSNERGELYSQTSTCSDWTSTAQSAGRPRVGFSWPAGGRQHWISGQDEGGCGAGVSLTDMGGSDPSNPIVGSGGGYGGFYCFALTP